jgi:ribonucleoside-triphosphate reductase
MSLDHIIAACVIAGGKRRSSRIAVKNWQDPDIFEFINCKREDGAHWTTNISVEVDYNFFKCYEEGFKWARDVMKAVIIGKRLNGEPGFWNRSLAMDGEREPELMFCPNPCGEIGLQMWENCNLGHINLAYFLKRGRAEMLEAFRLMTRWLIRATFGDIPQVRQRAVTNKNRRIGVGFFGFHEWVVLNGVKYSESWKSLMVQNRLKDAAEAVKSEAMSYSQSLGIPTPVKNTTLAPTGTIVMLPGTTPSGQAMPAIWFKRLVRYSDMDHRLTVKREEGYEVIVDDDAENTSIVVSWCEDPLAAKMRAAGWNIDNLECQYDISFEDSLRVQAMFQELYADNSISFTINMMPDKVPNEEEMEKTLFAYMPKLKGTTVYVEKSRKNSPIQTVTKAAFDAFQGPKQIQQVEGECKTGCPTT